MARWFGRRELPHPKPVQKVELSEEKIGLRFVIVAILIIIAVVSFTYGIRAFLTVNKGWTEIKTNSSADTNIGNEFVFMYNLGSGDMSATAENKILVSLYSDVMVDAYELFHTNEEFEHVNNVCYINQHPNEEIVVDTMLYQAFSLLHEYKDRNIYLAPVVTIYNDIFYCEDDAQTLDYDPYLNTEIAVYYTKIAEYAKDENTINIQLLGNNKIKLLVSDDYLDYCEENDITDFIDFSWMKNAFVVDYLAKILSDKGFTHGTISSYDGFSRNLDDGGTEFSHNIFDTLNGDFCKVATMQYAGVKTIVNMRKFPINALDAYRYYSYDNGDVRNLYLDIEDGMCKSVVNSLYAYATDYGCAEIMLQLSPIYIADQFSEDSLSALSKKGIFSIYCEDSAIVYNDEKLELKDIYVNENVTYQKQLQK